MIMACVKKQVFWHGYWSMLYLKNTLQKFEKGNFDNYFCLKMDDIYCTSLSIILRHLWQSHSNEMPVKCGMVLHPWLKLICNYRIHRLAFKCIALSNKRHAHCSPFSEDMITITVCNTTLPTHWASKTSPWNKIISDWKSHWFHLYWTFEMRSFWQMG